MATTDSPLVVSDAGPLIHLDELGCLDLLRDLGAILVPRIVWAETLRYRPQLTIADVPDAKTVDVAAEPSARLLSFSDSLELDVGERASLTLIEGISAKLFLCDDAAARLAAESLGFIVRGTIGIVVRSVRTAARTRQQVLALLRELPQRSSLHLSRQLLESVIAEVERSSEAV
jgi:predicted nucleic acid-binding protein